MTDEKMTMQSLIDGARRSPGRVVVPCADNDEALEGVAMARKEGIVSGGTLIGKRADIEVVARNVGLSVDGFEILERATPAESAAEAARRLARGQDDLLLKGQLDTKVYLGAILEKELALVPPGQTLAHVGVLEIPGYHKLLVSTDGGITIEPPLEQKLQLVENVLHVCRGLGVSRPKVAMIAAVEKVNPKMTSTVHADQVVKLAREGRFPGAVIEGPYDFYIATSAEQARIKQVEGEVCGDADALVFPELTSANVFWKTVHRFVKGAKLAGIVAGAKVPIVLMSRADSSETKYLSLVLAAFLKRRL
jgi:phosphate butyryltransferase